MERTAAAYRLYFVSALFRGVFSLKRGTKTHSAASAPDDDGAGQATRPILPPCSGVFFGGGSMEEIERFMRKYEMATL
jgi:hypothetical protein